MPHRISFIVLVAALVAVSLAGCDDNDQPFRENQWSYSDSLSQPDPFDLNGVRWVTAPWNGDHRWIYYPQQVFDLIQVARRLPPSTVLGIQIGGGNWVFQRDADKFHIQAPWESSFNIAYTVGDQADSDVLVGDWVPSAVVATVVVLIVIIFAGMYIAEEKNSLAQLTAAVQEEARQKEAAVKQREAEANKLATANEKWRKDFQAWSDHEKGNIERARQELTAERDRAMASINAAKESLASLTPTPGDVGKYLRERHVQGMALGECIDVTFLADRTGFLRLKWAIRLDRIVPPTLTIFRGEKQIRTDVAFSGEHGDHIICGRRYVYKFVLRDEKDRPLGKPLLLEVKTPTKQQWDDAFGSDESDHERKIRETFKSRFNGLTVIQELVQSATEDIKAKKYPSDIEEWLVSQVEGLAAELRGQ